MTEVGSAIEIINVSKSFDGVTAVDDVSVSVAPGEIFALLGGSGCGKTTLLRMLAGFEIPTTGEIKIAGQSMLGKAPYERPVNMMFQSYALFPHMNVEQNIAFGLKQEKLSTGEITNRVTEVLALVQMEQFRKRKPAQLSGGQQQRVALARSLAKKPSLLLLDEPMGALDKKLRVQMQLELANIIGDVGVTCMMVTHDQEEAMTMADRIAVMSDGRFMQIGKPKEIYENPNCRMTAEFIGSINLFAAKIDHNQGAVTCDDLDCTLQLGEFDKPGEEKHFVALRPEKIKLLTERSTGKLNDNLVNAGVNGVDVNNIDVNSVTGYVDDIAYLGSHTVLHIRLPSGKIVLVHSANMARNAEDQVEIDQPVRLIWDKDAIVLIPEKPITDRPVQARRN